jgi:hypothetical protein
MLLVSVAVQASRTASRRTDLIRDRVRGNGFEERLPASSRSSIFDPQHAVVDHLDDSRHRAAR